MTPDEIAELRRVVAVRPLEWTEYEREGVPDTCDAEAKPFGVYYNIELHHGGYRVFWCGQAFGPHDTLDLAKAAAQADYERRILSALALASRALPAAADAHVTATSAMLMKQAQQRSDAYIDSIREQAKREAYAWRPIETAPHNVNVLLAWPDLTLDAGWRIETGMASWGWRRGGVSNMSRHGQATHWALLQPHPAIEALAEKKT